MTDNVEQKDIEDLRERFLNRDFDEKEFEISAMGTLPNGDWAFTIVLNKLEY